MATHYARNPNPADEHDQTSPEEPHAPEPQHDAQTAPTFARVDILAATLVGQIRAIHLRVPSTSERDIQARWVQIVRLCTERCGSTSQGRRWLETQKMAFDWRKPIELLGTEAGCDQVTDLLKDL